MIAEKRDVPRQNLRRDPLRQRHIRNVHAALCRPGVNGKTAVYVGGGGDDRYGAQFPGKPLRQPIRAADVPGQQRNDVLPALVDAQHCGIRALVRRVGRDGPYGDAAGADKNQRVPVKQRADLFGKPAGTGGAITVRHPFGHVNTDLLESGSHYAFDPQGQRLAPLGEGEYRGVHGFASRYPVEKPGS